MAESARWYVVHTYSGYENTVKASIEKAVENRKMHDLIHEINIPVETVTEIVDSKTKVTEHKIFPGYVLVKMILTDESWHLVRNVRGVTGFVGSENKPIPLSEAEILSLGVERREIVVGVKVGDTVKKGDTLFIIESMKVMNEVQSEFDGKVKKILVNSGEAVEFDQTVMIID